MTKTQKIGYLEKVLINRMPKGWEKTLLKDVLEIQGGFAFDSKCFSDDNGIQLIRIRDLKNGYTTDSLYDGSYNEDYLVKAGDYLIGMDGDFICYQWKGQDSLLNQRVCRLRNFDKQANPRFVYFGINEHLDRINQKTSFATVKHISMKQIGAIEFALPPLPQQEKIVSVLDTASALVEKQKTLLEKYDLFLKSKFIEMFGDPILNSKALPIKSFSEVITLKQGIQVDVEEQYPNDNGEMSKFLRIINYTQNSQEFRYIEKQPQSRYVSSDDVVMVRYGATAGFVGFGLDGVLANNLFMIKPDEKILTKRYLFDYLRTSSIQETIFSFRKAAAMPAISFGDINTLLIPIPSLNEQVLYKNIAEQVDELKIKEQQKLEKLQTLYDALMKRAFDGEIE